MFPVHIKFFKVFSMNEDIIVWAIVFVNYTHCWVK